MVKESFGVFKIYANAEQFNYVYRVKGEIFAPDKSSIDEQVLFSKNDSRLTHDYSSREEANMTFLAQAKAYLQNNPEIQSFYKTTSAHIESRSNTSQKTHYNGPIVSLLPATDEMLQINLNDVIEKQNELTELYNFLQQNIITEQDFATLTKDKIGIFPQKVLLGTKDGYRVCGIYTNDNNTLSIGTARFFITLPEYLDNCIVSVEVYKI